MSYIYKTGRAELLDQIKRYKGLIRGRVLDIGGGSFHRYQHLFSFDEYVCMDVTEGKGVDVVGKIQDIPYGDNTFDSIVCTQVLGDIFELNRAFSEMNRVLKPSGIALITESLFDPLHDEPNDFWRFTEHSFRRLAEDANFKIEVLEKRGGYYSVMAQLKARYWIEKLKPKNPLFSRILSFKFKILGKIARFRDSKDKSRANKLYPHGYILIIRKHA